MRPQVLCLAILATSTTGALVAGCERKSKTYWIEQPSEPGLYVNQSSKASALISSTSDSTRKISEVSSILNRFASDGNGGRISISSSQQIAIRFTETRSELWGLDFSQQPPIEFRIWLERQADERDIIELATNLARESRRFAFTPRNFRNPTQNEVETLFLASSKVVVRAPIRTYESHVGTLSLSAAAWVDLVLQEPGRRNMMLRLLDEREYERSLQGHKRLKSLEAGGYINVELEETAAIELVQENSRWWLLGLGKGWNKSTLQRAAYSIKIITE